MVAKDSSAPTPGPTLPEEYKLVNIPATRTPVVLLCCGVIRLIVRSRSSQMRKTVSVSLTSLGRVSFLRVFFPFLFFKKQVLLRFARSWEVEDSAVSGTPVSKKYFHYQGPSPMRPNGLWTCPDTEPPGLAPGCHRRKLLVPFKKEEEGIGIACDIVKVQGRVPGLPIRDCAGGCKSSEHKLTTMSAIHVTAKTFFECLYLVPGLSPFEPRVKCPCAPTSPPFAEQLFLDFYESFPRRPLNFFVITIHQVIWPSPGTLVQGEDPAPQIV